MRSLFDQIGNGLEISISCSTITVFDRRVGMEQLHIDQWKRFLTLNSRRWQGASIMGDGMIHSSDGVGYG